MVTQLTRPCTPEAAAPADGVDMLLNLMLAQQVIRRFAADPFFAGAALSRFERRTGLEEDQLAAFLGCEVAALPRLALYRWPNPDSPRFGEQVQRIADRTGADVVRLATILLFAAD
jgi:hypothetical protein